MRCRVLPYHTRPMLDRLPNGHFSVITWVLR